MSDWAAPFEAVARWARRGVPPRLRGIVVAGPDLEPGALPRVAKVRLDLPEQSLLRRDLDLPAMAAERRAGWIQARLEEISPWAAGAFYWAEAGETDGKLALVLTAAEPVRVLADRLAAGGRRLVEVTAGPVWLVEDAAAEARQVRRLVAVWLVVLALGLGLAVWGWTRIGAAEAATALAEARLEKLVSAATTTSAASQAARELLGLKTDGASLATALDRLAGSLPLDSYLETLRLAPTEFQISGRSVAPEAIIPALEGTGGFVGVDFAGASSRDATSGLYSFTLTGRTGGGQ